MKLFRRTENPKKASEAELIKGCLKSERQFQEEFYSRYASKMLSVCCRYAKSTSEAEDILHEGFIKAFSKLDKFKGNGSLEGWVRRIMVNTSLENFRRQKNLQVVDEFEEENSLKMDPKALSNMSADEILGLVQKLPSGFRVVFNLYALEGYSHKDIAEELGISVGTSKSQLSRARAALQTMIQSTDSETYEEYTRSHTR